ncbi:MAG TPA: hypothetical protein VF432_10720 [Thermoanaerobaculia bacterium]
MLQDTHKLVTLTVFNLLRRRCPDLPFLANGDVAAQAAYDFDDQTDVELVDVESGRDDPHVKKWFDDDDVPATSFNGAKYTAFNHFIDIRKGPGAFDDFDGYSYYNGSASRDEFEAAENALRHNAHGLAAVFCAEAVGVVNSLGAKLTTDEAINHYLNDEYVHVRGGAWYRGCSPAMERYATPADRSRFDDLEKQLGARFPLAECLGGGGKGVPYSVFMPVDNVGQYWWSLVACARVPDPTHFGFVMHAVQDSSVPHHAAGCSGNWHSQYEEELNRRLPDWLANDAMDAEILALFDCWFCNDTVAGPLRIGDHQQVPGRNWRVEQLITWLALNAYGEYEGTYAGFRDGFRFDDGSARGLTVKALAVCLLLLARVSGYTQPQPKPAPQRAVVAEPRVLRFAGLLPGQSGTASFVVTASGELPVEITEITAPRTVPFRIASSIAQPLTLYPGQSLQIDIAFVMPGELPRIKNRFLARRPHNIRQVHSVFRTYSDHLEVHSNADNDPILSVQMQGGGRPESLDDFVVIDKGERLDPSGPVAGQKYVHRDELKALKIAMGS